MCIRMEKIKDKKKIVPTCKIIYAYWHFIKHFWDKEKAEQEIQIQVDLLNGIEPPKNEHL